MTAIKIGAVDRTELVFIPDPASTDGSGKTGLTHASFTVSYTRVETDNDVVVTDVTSSLTTLTNLTDAHADWGVKEVSSTLAPGLYRIDIADAVFASGAWSAVVYVMITSSAAAASPMKFELVAFDQLDGVRLGLTALPNAAADAAGGLPISDAGGIDLDAQIVTKINDILTDTGTTLDARIPAALVSGRIDASVGAMASGVLTATAIAADAITDAKVASDVTIASVTGAVGSVTGAVGSVTGNVGGNVTGSVGSIASGGIVAASFAADSITAAKLAADVTTELQAGLATAAAVAALSIPTANQNADALLDRTAGVETGVTVRQWFRLGGSSLFGKSSGLTTSTAIYRDVGDTKDRITATVASGNRTAVTLDAT